MYIYLSVMFEICTLVANGAMESKLRESEDHYTYVNMDQFDFDVELNFWKPRGSIGDK